MLNKLFPGDGKTLRSSRRVSTIIAYWCLKRFNGRDAARRSGDPPPLIVSGDASSNPISPDLAPDPDLHGNQAKAALRTREALCEAIPRCGHGTRGGAPWVRSCEVEDMPWLR